MTEQMVWLFAFVALYWAYCMQWGVSSARLGQGPDDFFLASRRLPAWVFVLCATGASFAGWGMMGYPSLVMRDGLPFAQLALAGVTIPLTGVLFMKRQWLLSKHFGHITPGEMLSDYFGGDALRILVVGIALVCAVPYVGMSLSATGYLVQWLSQGAVPASLAMWVLTAVVFLYVVIGGLRAVAYVGSLQGLLLGTGMLAMGLVALWQLGGVDGFGTFIQGLAKLGATSLGPWGSSAEGYNAYLHIPGVVQFTSGLGKQDPVAGMWTTAMILSTCFALMGIQATPAFSMLAYSCRDPKGFGPQQVWVSAAGVGLLLVFFALVQGLGADFLGASAALREAGLTLGAPLPDLSHGKEVQLYARYLLTLAQSAPWFMALLAVCALAAIHAMVSLFAATTGTIIVRDVFLRYLTPRADLKQQKFYARCSIAAVIFAALLLATFAPRAQALMGALALGFAVQLWPALAGVCWFPWITRQGVSVGLVAGLLGVLFTEPLGATLCNFLGFDLPWGRWPWTIHSAGWGIFLNIISCTVVSWISANKLDRAHRMRYHRLLAQTLALAPKQRFLRPVAWSLTLIWFFFAVGPGAVLGNDLFGAPNAGAKAWVMGVPSLWAWQMMWWALGVLILWFLAYRLQMSTRLHANSSPSDPVSTHSTSITKELI
jgi:SSS family solute:Na+ symporter